MSDSQLIESLEDCLRREKRCFIWIWVWLGALLGSVVLEFVFGAALAEMIHALYRAGQDIVVVSLVYRAVMNLFVILGLISLVAFPCSIGCWVGAIRRRQFSYAVLRGDPR